MNGMSIQEIFVNFKRLRTDERVYLPIIIVFVGISSFTLGKLSVDSETKKTEPVTQSASATLIERGNNGTSDQSTKEESDVSKKVSTESAVDGGYVASKSGTKYHLPWCSGAQRIKEENKIWFATKAEAESAGYTAAANCPGI